MSLNLPEIQVRYVLPVIRKELAQALIDLGLKGKEAATLLEITPAAISQYRKEKRASELQLSASLKKEIVAVATRLKDKQISVLEATMGLLHHNDMMKLICKYHKSKDDSLPHNCQICMK